MITTDDENVLYDEAMDEYILDIPEGCYVLPGYKAMYLDFFPTAKDIQEFGYRVECSDAK